MALETDIFLGQIVTRPAAQSESADPRSESVNPRPVPDPALHTSARVGMLVSDPVHYRLLEGVAQQLDLVVADLTHANIEVEDLRGFELIVADQTQAHEIHSRLTGAHLPGDAVFPAVISIAASELADEVFPALSPTDGILTLPQHPASLLAQLSVVLYAHRAFAQRYQGALDELHLNRRIFSSVTTGISIADATRPDMPLIYVNPAFEVMTGHTLESVLGKNCRFLQGDDTDQSALTTLRGAIAARQQVTVVLRNYRKDGTPFWNELSVAPIRNRDGQLTHFVGIQNDVTARVEFEAALRQSEKLAAVGRLAASIAHEINNPLESVMNLIYLAQQEEDPSALKHYLAEADSELKRVALITTQSLRFYRQNTRPQAVDCDDLLKSVLDLYAPKLTRFNIEATHTRRSGHTVMCMESEIRQVLSNIVRNAIDAMRGEGGTLQVRTRVMTEWATGRRGVALTVADNGSGISPAVVRKLYTAFFTTKGDVGTGLGLWVSANIVERHRGRMLVRSSEAAGRHGTVFTVFLPFDAMSETALS